MKVVKGIVLSVVMKVREIFKIIANVRKGFMMKGALFANLVGILCRIASIVGRLGILCSVFLVKGSFL